LSVLILGLAEEDHLSWQDTSVDLLDWLFVAGNPSGSDELWTSWILNLKLDQILGFVTVRQDEDDISLLTIEHDLGWAEAVDIDIILIEYSDISVTVGPAGEESTDLNAILEGDDGVGFSTLSDGVSNINDLLVVNFVVPDQLLVVEPIEVVEGLVTSLSCDLLGSNGHGNSRGGSQMLMELHTVGRDLRAQEALGREGIFSVTLVVVSVVTLGIDQKGTSRVDDKLLSVITLAQWKHEVVLLLLEVEWYKLRDWDSFVVADLELETITLFDVGVREVVLGHGIWIDFDFNRVVILNLNGSESIVESGETGLDDNWSAISILNGDVDLDFLAIGQDIIGEEQEWLGDNLEVNLGGVDVQEEGVDNQIKLVILRDDLIFNSIISQNGQGVWTSIGDTDIWSESDGVGVSSCDDFSNSLLGLQGGINLNSVLVLKVDLWLLSITNREHSQFLAVFIDNELEKFVSVTHTEEISTLDVGTDESVSWRGEGESGLSWLIDSGHTLESLLVWTVEFSTQEQSTFVFVEGSDSVNINEVVGVIQLVLSSFLKHVLLFFKGTVEASSQQVLGVFSILSIVDVLVEQVNLGKFNSLGSASFWIRLFSLIWQQLDSNSVSDSQDIVIHEVDFNVIGDIVSEINLVTVPDLSEQNNLVSFWVSQSNDIKSRSLVESGSFNNKVTADDGLWQLDVVGFTSEFIDGLWASTLNYFNEDVLRVWFGTGNNQVVMVDHEHGVQGLETGVSLDSLSNSLVGVACLVTQTVGINSDRVLGFSEVKCGIKSVLIVVSCTSEGERIKGVGVRGNLGESRGCKYQEEYSQD
jgi:hypothetical protein